MFKLLSLFTLSILCLTANQKWIPLESTNNSSFAMSKPYSYNKNRTTRTYKAKRSKGIRLIDQSLLNSIKIVQDQVKLTPYKRNQ